MLQTSVSIYATERLGRNPNFTKRPMSDLTPTVGPGTILAERYELIDEIGRGGFGMVYRAKQLNMDREVAVKLLPPNFMSIPDVVERFKREAQLASRLRHPNTITLHDYGSHENVLYIVMELLTGEDLADVLKRDGKLPVKRAIKIARQVLKSLSEAHEQGIVHRDLKPENVFLSVVGEDTDVVKVLDFGIAKLASPRPEDAHDEKNRALTISGSTVGTPTYMSPEQAAGEEVTGQSDLYTLGVILYEMINGRPPFHNRDPVKVMRSHLFDEVPPMRITELQGSVIERVIRKALEKELPDRFQNANEFLLALAGEPVARPKVQGVELRKLEELSAPSSEAEEEGFHQTLQFIDSQRKSADEIPFDSLKKGTHLTPPPAAIVAQGSTTSSSIIRVIEAPQDDEVIVLTTRKEPTPSGAGDSHERIQRVDTSMVASQPLTTPQQGTAAVVPEEGWQWGEDVPTGDHTAQSSDFSAVSTRPPIWPFVLGILVLVAASFFFMPGLRALLPF